MRTDQALESANELVVRCLDPDAVFAFGSAARGHARRDSDIDLLVVARFREPSERRAAEVRGLLAELAVPVDLLAYTPAEFELEKRTPYSFADMARRHGVMLYERRKKERAPEDIAAEAPSRASKAFLC